MKTTILFVAILFCLACAGKAQEFGEPPVQLEFWYPSPWSAAAMQTAIDAFETSYPGIKVNMTVTNWCCVVQDVQAAAAEGRAPDIIYMGNTQIGELQHEGLLAPLGKYFAQWRRDASRDVTAEYWQQIPFDYFLKGEWWASPVSSGTRLLFWNRQLVRDVIGEERAPETWDELKEWARRINETVDGVWGIGAQMAGNDAAHFFTPMAHSMGASWFDDEGMANVRTEEMEAALDFWTSFYRDGLTPYADGSFLEYDQMFLENKLAFYAAGSWLYWSFQPFVTDLGTSPLPSGSIGKFQFLGGEGMGMSSQTQHKDEAWQFMRFMTDTDEGWGIHVAQIGIPSRRTVTTERHCAQAVLPAYQWDPVQIEIGALLEAVPLQFPNENSATVRLIEDWNTLPRHLQAINRGEMTVIEAADSMTAWLNEQIEEIYRVILPVVDLSSYEVPLVVIISIFMALTLVGAVLTFVYRENAFIRCASPIFLYMIWLGAFLGYASLYTWAYEATQTSCIFKYWLSSCGFVMLFAALFAKTWRVYRLFANKQLVALRVSNMDVMMVVLGFTAVQVLLLILWTSINTPDAEYFDVSNDSERQLQCTSDNYWVWMGLTYGYLAAIVLVGAVLAFLSRKAARAFNETRQIAFAIYAVLVIGGIILPLVQALDDTPEAVIILAVVGGLVGTTVVLCAIFLPKFIPIFQGKDASAEDITGYNSTSGSTRRASSLSTSSPSGNSLSGQSGSQ